MHHHLITNMCSGSGSGQKSVSFYNLLTKSFIILVITQHPESSQELVVNPLNPRNLRIDEIDNLTEDEDEEIEEEEEEEDDDYEEDESLSLQNESVYTSEEEEEEQNQNRRQKVRKAATIRAKATRNGGKNKSKAKSVSWDFFTPVIVLICNFYVLA